MNSTSENHKRYTGLIARYPDRLPVKSEAQVISLGEGATPLIRLQNIPGLLESEVEIFVKYEGLNPTGSFKDRGMTVAVTAAVQAGSQSIICASTGNTSAAAAAYAARADIVSFVLIPEGKIALGKLAQAMMHGAKVIQIEGNFDDGMRLVKQVSQEAPVTLVNSVNPNRIEGQKTAAFEIIEDLGRAPDFHCLPVGNAGNITAYWRGYQEYFNDQLTQTRPTMVGYQASGAAPFVSDEMIDRPETIATAIRIGHPQSWDQAKSAKEESGGWFAPRTDDQILEVQKLLAGREGIFCEPASAVSLAGAIHDIKNGHIPSGSKVVCTLTGHGLKDPDTAISQCGEKPVTVKPELDAIKEIILRGME